MLNTALQRGLLRTHKYTIRLLNTSRAQQQYRLWPHAVRLAEAHPSQHPGAVCG